MTDNASDHWNRVYKARPIDRMSWHQQRPDLSVQLISSAVGPEASVIDVGGGASVLADSLFDCGFRDISVLDTAAVALVECERRLKSSGRSVVTIECDIREFQPRRKWELWHDRAVFHFMTTPSDRDGYLRALRAGLMEGGVAVIATFGPDGPEKCSGLPCKRYDAAAMLEVLGSDFELMQTANEDHRTPDDVRQSFVYGVFRRTTVS